MKKRELSSPSLRENKEDNNQTKKIGCMPGIFFFFHRNNHYRSRKRLTSGKMDKNVESKTKSTKTTTITTSVTSGEKTVVTLKRAGSPDVVRTTTTELKKTGCDVPRSQTIPSEIRIENSSVGGTGTSSSPATPRKPPALVARLMGLDEIPVSPPSSVDIAEKRRKLLGALEKCDEDLKALKKIIDAVRLAESRKLLIAGGVVPVVESTDLTRVVDKKEYSEHELSPVSVINGIGSPSSPSQEEQEQQHLSPEFRQGIYDRDHDKKKRTMMAVKSRRRKRNCKRSTATANTTVPFFHRATIEGVPRKGGSGGGRKWTKNTPSRCSKEKAECVEEVCKDGIVEERWEFGRVGVALEGDIFKDMVEEMVEEFAVFWTKSGGDGGNDVVGRLVSTGLPFDGCRRRLCL